MPSFECSSRLFLFVFFWEEKENCEANVLRWKDLENVFRD
jgi:hypothetical protein